MMCAIEFIPSGALRREPLRHELSPEEAEMMKSAGNEEAAMNDGAEEEEEFEELDEDDNVIVDTGDKDEYGLPASLRMDEYDDDEEGPSGMLSNAMLSQYDDEDDEGSDAEDNVIESTDMVMMSARTDEEISILEVHCYDPKTGNLWIHHDITLAAFPLSIAFLDMPPSTTNNNASGAYVAVGTFKPGIEIWNLDVLDPLEPSAVLGGPDMTYDTRPKKGKNGKKKKPREPPLLGDSHADAVMAIDWNRTHRQVLASGGADTVVKLWDVTTQQCSHTCTHHTDKVQAVAWHPTEGAVLATGSYDRTICVLDARSPSAVSTMHMPADLECLAWDPHNLEKLIGCSEDGTVACFDPRNPTTALWTMNAHPTGVSSMVFAPLIPGMFATASADKTVKLWDCSVPQPVCVGQREIGVGKLFGLSWSNNESNPWTVACAGSKGIVGIWEVDESDAITARFGPRLSQTTKAASESNASTVQQQQVSESGELQAQVEAGIAGQAPRAAQEPKKKNKKKKSDKKKTLSKN